LVIGEADPFDDVDAVIIQHGVGFCDQVVQHSLSLRMFEIDRERALVAVELEKARRKIGIFAGTEEAERIHAAFARFDFDHVGAELGQDRRAVRSGKHVIEADDAHAVERRGGAASACRIRCRDALLAVVAPTIQHRHAPDGRTSAVDDERHRRLFCTAETSVLDGR
jgi:hypothetical protein